MRHESYVAQNNEFVAWLTCFFNLLRDIIWMLATYSPQFATRYDLCKYEVKIMFSYHILNIAGIDTFQYIDFEGIL